MTRQCAETEYECEREVVESGSEVEEVGNRFHVGDCAENDGAFSNGTNNAGSGSGDEGRLSDGMGAGEDARLLR